MSFPKATCPNCTQLTEVQPPRYRCKHCMYPMQKTDTEYHSSAKDINNSPSEALKMKIPPVFLQEEQKGSEEEVVQETPPRETIFERLSQRETAIRKSPSIVEFTQHENNNAIEQGRQEAAWLVVHMPDTKAHVYTLYVGENVFGRPSKKYIADLPLQDEYISRAHAIIYIEKDSLTRFHYRLVDDGSKRDGRVSANGTYVNGISDRLPADGSAFLKDGDLIQVGYTILVFKSKETTASIEEAVAETSVLPFVEIIKQNWEE